MNTIIKNETEMSLEQRTKLEIFIKKYPDLFFAESNEADSWGDFNKWPTSKTDRQHLVMPGEICIIDRLWNGRHAYVACKFYAKGEKVKDLFPIVYVDDLPHREWKNGYFLIPDLRDNKPVDGWEPNFNQL